MKLHVEVKVYVTFDPEMKGYVKLDPEMKGLREV
jgi:hypothetical protein